MPPNSSYGPEQPAAEAVLELQKASHSLHELQKAGYIISQLPATELERKKRCDRCSKALKRERRSKPRTKEKLPLAPVSGGAPYDTTAPEEVGGDAVHGEGEAQTEQRKEKAMICKFHPGRVFNRAWTCCNKPPNSPPCLERDHHVPHQYKPGELENHWSFHKTPHAPLPSHVAAVVIDCEMGTASSGETELIRISMVEYFTGAVLIDKLVYPSVPMAHYNTRFSGVTRPAMEAARRKNDCFLGRDAARKAVHDFVGPKTVVIGHGANGDLMCLRWVHRVIVDTLLVESQRRQLELFTAEALKHWPSADKQQEGADAGEGGGDDDGEDEGEGEGEDNGKDKKSRALRKESGLSLKALTLKRLNRVIQIPGRGHDSLEDAQATRDLLHWYMTNPFDTLVW
ncbi:hypothetical protein E4U35_006975 [Claviceps purpurea]|nr:hypothetical protein E4U51_003208 [Claviceps purpurea]KAG6199446.1 hypothetical protein E4U10_004815 [Claviceps purpurea]KAG6209527.1 hypothetical protein E4U35_006975 [Claviceps purpurea]KAG6241233.1 hypothetical protein E4U25_006669 [Claviceps purpurea]KAG6251059.1 hypothetical protein E4U23_000991 [Claviceps purpurea]